MGFRDSTVIGLLIVFFLSLPVAGFLQSLGFLALALAALIVTLFIVTSE